VLADQVGDCDVGGNPSLGVVEIDTPVADPTNGGGDGHSNGVYYLDDRNYLLGDGMWLYEETNGIGGLQRGGHSNYIPDDNEICTDDPNVEPDQLLF
jgi:hypothetical protein